jgi:hypothetical protein
MWRLGSLLELPLLHQGGTTQERFESSGAFWLTIQKRLILDQLYAFDILYLRDTQKS